MDKGTQFRQGDAFTKEALLPEMDVAADNASGSFLINRRIAVTDAADPGSCFIGDDDRVLVRSFNAGIRDYGRKQQRVCTTTLRALYPADLEHKDLIGEVDASAVIAMYGQAGGMAA